MSKQFFSTPLEAELAFYRAFEMADLSTMTAVWSRSDYVECIHPMGQRIKGPGDVIQSWKQIFYNPPKFQINIVEQNFIEQENLAIHVVIETILVEDQNQSSKIFATNIYERSEDGWRMILHHASPAPRPASSTSTHGNKKSPQSTLH